MNGKVYLIPSALSDDDKASEALPAYIVSAVKDCSVFFAENKKSARRFLKKVFKEIVIDAYEWYEIDEAEKKIKKTFLHHLQEGKNIGIISEAGCPGIADPGQLLVDAAQQTGATLIPLVGPSSILLALMASGMNGQCFQFVGYLPIESSARKKTLKELEEYSRKKNCTQIFIETPYRNNQLLHDILAVCKSETKLCIGADITSSAENIHTQKIREWKNSVPDLHKRPAIFLIYAS